jgi:hypothetical protein
MKAIPEHPKRGAPISPAIGPSWPSERGLDLANAIVREQSWVRKLVIRWMSAKYPENREEGMRKQPEDAPSVPGGHAAERLREFLRGRLPAGASTDELNPELVEKAKRKDGGPDQRDAKEKDNVAENGDKPGNP